RYDAPEPGQTADYGSSIFNLRGKLVSIRDRGAHTRFAYDGRGRRIGVARRVAKPGVTDAILSSRYTEHWFRTASTFDELDRVETISTGADVAELLNAGQSILQYHYSQRGRVSAVDGSYGTLLESQRFAADGAPESKVFGDAGRTEATYTYYPDR